MYSALFFIHVVAAVMGLGAVFGFPMIAKSAKTVSQAKHVLHILKSSEILPKVGSITLLVTGLLMGLLEPSLFKTGWFLTSIALYLAAQVVVIGFLPKNMKAQLDILEKQTSEELPQEYISIGKQSAKLEGITHILALLLIIMMVFKPF